MANLQPRRDARYLTESEELPRRPGGHRLARAGTIETTRALKAPSGLRTTCSVSA